MNDWIILRSVPPLAFYRDRQRPTAAPNLAFRRLINFPTLYSRVSVEGGNENANVTVTLANGDGALSVRFSRPPLRMRLELYRDETLVLDGIVTEMTVGSQVSLTVQT